MFLYFRVDLLRSTLLADAADGAVCRQGDVPLVVATGGGAVLRISAKVTDDFGIVTGLGSMLGCAEKIVGVRSC